ncbi:MAG TPA: HAD hydrolase-like protein [Pyrinomonadaceae bacterium]|jgi:phosphoglycolate phosphatase-like HAD superfamily hydrolase
MSSNYKVQGEQSEKQIRIPHSEIRILLWDIDGTLLVAPRNGSYKEYFAPAMERVYGSIGILRGQLKVSGMTDLQIAFESLQSEGFSVEQIYAKCDEFCLAIGEEIERICAPEENRFVALPGAREVLEATDAHPRFVNGLLTGNLPLAARFKLEFVGLHKFFDFSLGAFGNESHRRIDLPAVAARNVSAKFDYEFAPSQFIVLGDTPNDIACAKHFGAKSVAVATSRNHPAETLVPHKPDYLLNNLTDPAEVLRVLENL